MANDTVRVRITADYIRDRLVADAKKHYRAPHLAGLDTLEPEPREHHKRAHTIYVSPEIAKQAVPGRPDCCAGALAMKATHGIFAAFVLQRVAYTLERDEANKWAIYKFGTPDMFRRRIVAFDKGRGMKPHSVTFNPLPFSRTAGGVKAGKGTGKPKRKKEIKTRRRNPSSLLRMSQPDDLAA